MDTLKTLVLFVHHLTHQRLIEAKKVDVLPTKVNESERCG